MRIRSSTTTQDRLARGQVPASGADLLRQDVSSVGAIDRREPRKSLGAGDEAAHGGIGVFLLMNKRDRRAQLLGIPRSAVRAQTPVRTPQGARGPRDTRTP